MKKIEIDVILCKIVIEVLSNKQIKDIKILDKDYINHKEDNSFFLKNNSISFF